MQISFALGMRAASENVSSHLTLPNLQTAQLFGSSYFAVTTFVTTSRESSQYLITRMGSAACLQ